MGTLSSLKSLFTAESVAKALYEIFTKEGASQEYQEFAKNLDLFRQSKICRTYKTENSIWKVVCGKINQSDTMHHLSLKKYVPVCYFMFVRDKIYCRVKSYFNAILKKKNEAQASNGRVSELNNQIEAADVPIVDHVGPNIGEKGDRNPVDIIDLCDSDDEV